MVERLGYKLNLTESQTLNSILYSILLGSILTEMVEFKNRKDELELLDELYEKKSPKLIVLYGRRRVGKTELLKEFLKSHKGIYMLARQETEAEQLKTFSVQMAGFFGDSVLKLNPFTNWDALFEYLAEKPRMPIVIDEFPYLVQSSKKITSILQDYWDNKFSKRGAFIVLCGSSIAMMERLLGHKSPIYGRRTEQILLEPLKFRDSCLFFPKSMSPKEKVTFYSILGGMPAYLLEFDFSKSLEENLLSNLLRKNKLLYNDVFFVLREELKEPRNYFSILYSVAKGNTKISRIVNDTGLEKSFINKYLGVLIDLQLVERRVPITEKNPKKSRQGIYLIKDNFLKFWFRFVFENQEHVEQERQEKLLKEKIIPELNSFVGRIFEDIALSEIKAMSQFKNYLFGRWWHKDREVDIVGIDKTKKEIIIGEVKFAKLKKSEIEKIKYKLKEYAEEINIYHFKEKYVVVCLDADSKVEGIEVIKIKL
jgi:uncharacterized protein